MTIGSKLNVTNYALWCQIMEMYISKKDQLQHITSNIPYPKLTNREIDFRCPNPMNYVEDIQKYNSHFVERSCIHFYRWFQ
ncbi:hypothetical protein CR513_13077, partial [Mucuna pruriens]